MMITATRPTLTTTEWSLLYLVAAGVPPGLIADLLGCERADLVATMGVILAKLRPGVTR